MSEAAEKLNEELEPEVQENEPEKQEIDTTAILAERESKLAEKAKAQGWKSLEEHIESGGDPEEWRPPGEFILYGDMQGRIKDFERGFENRAQRLDKYYKAQFEVKRKELEDKFEQAVDEGDPEQIRKAKKQLDAHDKQEEEIAQPPANQVDPVVMAWNQKNRWVSDPNDPKAPFAHVQWQQIVASGKYQDSASAITELERRIAEKFPAEQKPRGHVPGSESGKGGQGFKGKSRALTWSDLTGEEEKVFKTGVFGDDKDKFLKAVKDARDAEARENG